MADRNQSEDDRDADLRCLQLCLRRLPLLMAVHDRAGRYVWCFNAPGGGPPDSVRGKTSLELGDDASLRVLHELVLRVLETGETLTEELELPTAGGQRAFDLSVAPLVEQGVRVGVSTVGIDITEAEARTRMREEQLRLTAHDLRQPLNVIAISASRLARVVERDSEVGSISDSINASVRAMGRVLEDILETGEWETGAVLLRRERIAIEPFLRETFTASVAPAGLLRIRLEIENACEVEADRAKLSRAVLNLVDNALKFSPPNTPVTVSAGREAGVLRIAVRDRGPGLDVDTQTSAFDKYRASSGSRASGGKGLGLYAARLIIEAHGGSCGVASTDGPGATFVIELPCVSASPPC